MDRTWWIETMLQAANEEKITGLHISRDNCAELAALLAPPEGAMPSWQTCTRCGAAILNEHPEALEPQPREGKEGR